ncbi:response regulator transcription factor [Leptolyngbya ohadii]|uniref:response regulator transcription factor n=1 Tax=Leptolyngbya ohadii TaxID=1962290 RepID=UPI000B598C02|nr:response regulator transcription factor [Leptolyngbya ohadii]
MKVLLVEDDPLAGKLLSATLTNHRYTVDLATDGQQGFELADQFNYDLILLDVQLPKLDGIHLCQKLRARGCSTPILMLTACDSNEGVIQGLDAGADDYVIKPCDPEQLAARMRSLLRRREKQVTSPYLQWGDLTLNLLSAEVTYREETVALTAKEYGLLELFLRHPQRVFSRSALLDLL